MQIDVQDSVLIIAIIAVIIQVFYDFILYGRIKAIAPEMNAAMKGAEGRIGRIFSNAEILITKLESVMDRGMPSGDLNGVIMNLIGQAASKMQQPAANPSQPAAQLPNQPMTAKQAYLAQVEAMSDEEFAKQAQQAMEAQ